MQIAVAKFHLVDLIIRSHELLKFNSSHWLKLQNSDWRENLVKDFSLQINFPPMRALKYITSHVIFKLRYNQIYQMKTPIDTVHDQNAKLKTIRKSLNFLAYS